jgi:hypothetical protein
MNIDILYLLVAICGGAFGAAIGALPAFIMCGIIGLFGVASGISGADFNWHGILTFGPFFGPHIAFAGGAAATAYAKKMGYLDSGRDIVAALMGLKKPQVILVGGIFGGLGYLIQTGAAAVFTKGQFDTVAFTVVAVALISKVVFGNGLLGPLTDEAKARGRFAYGGENVWLPWQETMAEKVVIAIAAGGLSAFVTHMMLLNPATAGQAPYVGFLVSATLLLFLQYGTTIPVTHHLTLCAAYGVLFSGGDILWGIAIAVIAAQLADIGARLFLIHGDTHVDPPAFAIFTGSLVAYLLKIAGVYAIGGVILPIAIIAIFVVWGIYDKPKSTL